MKALSFTTPRWLNPSGFRIPGDTPFQSLMGKSVHEGKGLILTKLLRLFGKHDWLGRPVMNFLKPW